MHPLAQAMFDDYQAGLDQGQLATKYDKHQSQVSKILNSHPAWANRRKKVQPSRRISQEVRQEIVDVYIAGFSVAKTAEIVGTGRAQVRRTLDDAGIQIRPQSEAQSGQHNGCWKGEDRKNYRYLACPDHPYANWQGEVAEHRLVMEAILGRYLLPQEVVHHKNKKRSDNRPENLELFSSNAEHLKAELTGCVPRWTEEGRRRTLEGARRPRGMRAVPRLQTPDDPPTDDLEQGIGEPTSRSLAYLFGMSDEPFPQVHTSTEPPPEQPSDLPAPSPTHETEDVEILAPERSG